MKEKLKRLIPSKRKIMQLYFALLFNANLKGFVTGNIHMGNTKKMCVPGINCYSCPGAIGSCPLGSLQGSFQNGHSTIFYVCGILLLYSLMFGRMICGWLCPFGLVQELAYKIKTPKMKKSPITRLLSWLKYGILVFFVFIVPIMYALRNKALPAFCKYICPAGTLEGGIGLLSNAANEHYLSMLGPLFTWKFMLMVSILVGCIFIFRLFCRFICPLGALYGIFNKISIFGIKLDNSKCTQCGLCQAHCKVDIKHVGDQECISCGECIDVCPTKAISFKGFRANPSSNEKHKKLRTVTRSIVAAVMVIVLVGAVIYFWTENTDPILPTNDASQSNQETTPDQEQETAPTVQLGNQVGDLCYGYDLEIVTGEGVSTETIDPTATGKITVINFWGTWCGPCVQELPYFDQIATNYADTVSVIAIHTNSINETAPGFIAENYPDSNITFARDYLLEKSEGYYTTLGGRGTYPYTVVLDENGIISQIFWKSLHYEDLENAVESLLEKQESAVEQEQETTPAVPLGNQVGDLCYGYDLEIVTGEGVSTETIDPTATGKITVINFWGTWCGPCVQELPYFDQLATNYADTVSVIAIHTNSINETAPGFIAENYPDSNIIFARDYLLEKAEGYYTTLGGRGTYPYTVILDENGVISQIFWKSLHYEDLEEAVASLLAS